MISYLCAFSLITMQVDSWHHLFIISQSQIERLSTIIAIWLFHQIVQHYCGWLRATTASSGMSVAEFLNLSHAVGTGQILDVFGIQCMRDICITLYYMTIPVSFQGESANLVHRRCHLRLPWPDGWAQDGLIDGQGINGRQTQSLIDGLREASQTDQPERGMEMQPERLSQNDWESAGQKNQCSRSQPASHSVSLPWGVFRDVFVCVCACVCALARVLWSPAARTCRPISSGLQSRQACMASPSPCWDWVRASPALPSSTTRDALVSCCWKDVWWGFLSSKLFGGSLIPVVSQSSGWFFWGSERAPGRGGQKVEASWPGLYLTGLAVSKVCSFFPSQSKYNKRKVIIITGQNDTYRYFSWNIESKKRMQMMLKQAFFIVLVFCIFQIL